ncbi:hypothetical protein EDB89DRAFT_2229291 [Lactarius sanguifluus]|nr:hypothetical protein EDB89DRAFT_2229291 [Lactarius sanguifluus]
MTNAHERITLPPISSFDISPSRKPHNRYPPTSPSTSRRPPHINGSPSWDGSSTASNPLRRGLDDARYDPEALVLGVPYRSHDISPSSSSFSRQSPSTYDPLDYSAHARGNHSPYSEPVGLVASPDHPPHPAPRPRSSSPSLDRDRRPVVPQVSCSRFHRIAQRLTCPPSRYHPPFHHFAQHSRHLAPYVSSREHSPDSRESHSRSSTHSPNVPTRSHPGTVPSPHAGTPAPAVTPTSAATSTAPVGGATGGVPAQMAAAAFINTTPGDAQDVVMGSERRRTSPVRKRKASEMLGTSASPGSDERAISAEPSESEAKKKYKKKMNVRHYRAQNKDAMTQLRDALPEHMRPPERQAKAYVFVPAAIKYIRELTAENERLRAENVKQAQELADRPSHDPERSGSGEVAITGETNDNDDDSDVVPKAEVPVEGE